MKGTVWSLVLAGGVGARLGGEVPKVLLPLVGEPVLLHALRALLAPEEVVGAVVPCVAGLRARVEELVLARLPADKPVLVVEGGAERQDSVRAALAAVPPDAAWILVHDGARPNPSAALVDRLLAARRRGRAVIPVRPLTDTIKRVDGDGRVLETVARGALRCAQTPQLFERALLERAHEASAEACTDDAGLVERLGETVWTVEGEAGNLKLTLPGDLPLLEYWMRRDEEG